MLLAVGVQLCLGVECVAEAPERAEERVDLVDRVLAGLGVVSSNQSEISFEQSAIRRRTRGSGGRPATAG